MPTHIYDFSHYIGIYNSNYYTSIYLNIFAYSIIGLVLFFSAVRTIKFRRMQALRFLNVQDLNIIVLIALIMTMVANSRELYFAIPIVIIFILAGIFFTLDAILSMEYGYQLDWETIKLAWQQRKAMAPTSKENKLKIFVEYLHNQQHLFLLPILFAFYNYGLLMRSLSVFHIFLAFYYAIALLVLTKSKLNRKTFLPWVAIGIAIAIIQYYFQINISIQVEHRLFFWSIVLSLLLLCNLIRMFIKAPFFQIPSLPAQLFSTHRIKFNKKVELTVADEAIIKLTLQPPTASEQHGKLAKANVIVIYLESVNAYSMKNSVTQQPNLPFFEKLLSTGWSSDYHVCISPNTNGSLQAFFSSQYAVASPTHYLELLKAQQYKTVLLAATDLHGGTKELVQQIGFEEVLYFKDSSIPHARDSDFYQHKLPKLKKLLTEKDHYFLTIHNQQTHLPYAVYNEPPKQNSYQRYQQAMYEADQAIEQLIQQLDLPMDNTLIIYTSDHGQSFGQFGFTAHSNSVVKEQINVPLVFSHPKLSHRVIAHSSHFDVMPTVMDLLGIDYPSPIVGQSMAHATLPFSHLVFSETRHGKLPSCFAHINTERKLFFDLNYHRFFWLTLEDEIIARLSKQEVVHYQEVMLRALEARELIDRPYS